MCLVIEMIIKAFWVLKNGLRYLGYSDYKNLLCVHPDTRIEKASNATLRVGSGFRTRRNVELNVREAAELTIGANVFLNTGCIITVRENLCIGEGTIFGPNVMVFDHDHKMVDGRVQGNEFDTAPISIGKRVWIGAGSIILKGSVIEDDCVIAAGSVVKGTVPQGSVLIQSKNTRVKPLMHGNKEGKEG